MDTCQLVARISQRSHALFMYSSYVLRAVRRLARLSWTGARHPAMYASMNGNALLLNVSTLWWKLSSSKRSNCAFKGFFSRAARRKRLGNFCTKIPCSLSFSLAFLRSEIIVCPPCPRLHSSPEFPCRSRETKPNLLNELHRCGTACLALQRLRLRP